MEKFTTKHFQKNFDELFSRVQNGETFVILDEEHGEFVITPAQTLKDIQIAVGLTNNDDELIRIHTDHEEGS